MGTSFQKEMNSTEHVEIKSMNLISYAAECVYIWLTYSACGHTCSFLLKPFNFKFHWYVYLKINVTELQVFAIFFFYSYNT